MPPLTTSNIRGPPYVLERLLLLPLLPLHASPKASVGLRPLIEVSEISESSGTSGSTEENDTSRGRFRDHGRPLSIIESMHSSSSDEEEETVHRSRAIAAHIEVDGTKLDVSSLGEKAVVDDLEAQIFALFERYVPETNAAITSEDGSTTNNEEKTRSIKVKDLPQLLDTLARQTGGIILEAGLRDQVDSFAETNPELRLQPESVIAMIRQLRAARESEVDLTVMSREDTGGEQGDAADVSQELKQIQLLKNTENLTSDDSDFDTSSDEGVDHEAHNLDSAASTPHDETSNERKGSYNFPRSQSNRADLSSEGIEVETVCTPRKTTSSDPAKPQQSYHRRASAPVGQQSPSSRTRQRTESSGDREVLKGKGKVKAPPSAWSRPKPQALANRDRNRKISGSSTASGSFDGDFDHRSTSSPLSETPALSTSPPFTAQSMDGGLATRQRLSSQPNLASRSIATGQIPRSASTAATGFIFPRSTSSPEVEAYDAEASERWSALVDDVRIGADTSDRAMSPSLDESSYYKFNPISPTYNADTFVTRRGVGNSRRSSGTGKRYNSGDETLTGEEHLSSLQAQLEIVQRQLSDKNRSIEQMQKESEEYISRLQEEVEEVRNELSLRRKEDSLNRVRENIHLDTIASLEADLNKASSELETLRAQHARLRTDHDEVVIAMERHTARNYEYREELEKAKAEAQESAEVERQWDVDRETYRETIKGLNAEIAGLQQKILGREEDTRVISSLQANLESLGAELEEARNRGTSHLLGSRIGSEADGTLSKRLGAELARSFKAEPAIPQAEEMDDEMEDVVDGDGDRSNDSVIVIHRRRRRAHAGPSRSIELADTSTQTELQEADQGNESAPPTYDEARLEHDVTSRLHPAWSKSHIQNTFADTPASQSYLKLARELDLRCTHFETHLGRSSVEAIDEHVGADRSPGLASKSKLIIYRLFTKSASSSDVRDALSFHLILIFMLGAFLSFGLSALLAPKAGQYAENAKDWQISNTLQVPWSGGAPTVLQVMQQSKRQRSLLSHIVGLTYDRPAGTPT